MVFGPAGAGASAASGAATPAGRGSTGSLIRNVVPCPGSLSTPMVPPCSSTMPRQSDSPSPVPSPGGFVVKKGSKILARIAAGIPGPVSAMARRTCCPVRSRPVVMVSRRGEPLPRIAWCAFATMFTSIWWSWCPSAQSTGRSSARARETETLPVLSSYASSSTASCTT